MTTAKNHQTLEMPKTSTTHSDFHYSNGRTTAVLEMPAEDQGIVFRHGLGPDDCDQLNVREAVVYKEDGLYHLFYDGAGAKGWLACLATSTNLVDWQRHGPVLDFGEPGSPDSAAATSPWMIFQDGWWHMFYLGTPNTSPAPEYVPSFPYLTLKARARKLKGPWEKQYEVDPFKPKDGTWHSLTSSPGYVIEHEGEFLQFFSGTTCVDGSWNLKVDDLPPNAVRRTCGIARTKDLNGAWSVDPDPIVPIEEQIENSSIYYEPSNQTWFLFTNHIGVGPGEHGPETEYTDAIWVYWTKDPNHWNSADKAVVLDPGNCTWADRCIGMPSVIAHEGRLAILYDAAPGDSINHMSRHIGLCWLDLPLSPVISKDFR